MDDCPETLTVELQGAGRHHHPPGFNRILQLNPREADDLGLRPFFGRNPLKPAWAEHLHQG